MRASPDLGLASRHAWLIWRAEGVISMTSIKIEFAYSLSRFDKISLEGRWTPNEKILPLLNLPETRMQELPYDVLRITIR